MESTKVSNLLLSWLWSNGHQIVEHKVGEGISTTYGKEEYKFALSPSYGGIRVEYNLGIFSFYKEDKLIKQSNLYECGE